MKVTGLLSMKAKTNSAIEILRHSRNIAKYSAAFQVVAIAIFLFFMSIYPASHSNALFCGLVAIIISFLPVLYSLSQRNFEIIFSCISLFNLAPIWFLYLEAILPGYDAFEYSAPIYRVEAFFWIAIFQLFVNMIYYLFWKPASKRSVNIFSFLENISLSGDFFFKSSLLAFFVPLIVLIFHHGSLSNFWTVLVTGRADGNSGGLIPSSSDGRSSSYLMPFIWLWQLTPLFSSITFVSANRKLSLKSLFSVTLGIAVVFIFFLGGTRATMIFVAGPFLFFLFFYNWQRGWRFWSLAIVLFLSTIAIMEFQVRFRNDSILEVLQDPAKAAKSKGLNASTTFDPTQSHRDNNMYLFCLLIKGYPEKYSFEGFGDFIANIVNPIPRSLWPNKPVLQGAKELIFQYPFVLDGPLYMGTTSLTYSIVGEAYLSNGLWGLIVYAVVYSIFLLGFDGLTYFTKSKQPVAVGVLGISVFLAFWSYRAFFSLTSYIYPLLLLVLILRLVAYFAKTQVDHKTAI